MLTPWHTEADTAGFTAYAFYDPDALSGVLLAFRQEKCREDTLSLSLPFARPGDRITLVDEDTGCAIETDSTSAAKGGVTLRFAHPRQARLLWIHGS